MTGRLQKHFEQAGIDGVKVSAIYETLRASIMQKSAFSEDGLGFDDLMASKSLSRSEVDELFSSASAMAQSPIEDWEVIRSDLAAAGFGSVQQLRLKTAAIRYYYERKLGHANAEKLARTIREWTDDHAAQINACSTIVGVADLIRTTVATSGLGYEGADLIAATLIEAYGVIHEQS